MSEPFENNPEEAAVETALPMPGGVLRAAREAQGYSLAEVAQVLKFSLRQLEALESDDYSTLQGTTFIRGFVRSYARYLRLDEVPLLAALEPKAPVAVVEVRTVENMNAEMPVMGADGSKRAYGFAAGLLVLGVLAWFFLQERATPVAEGPAAQLVAPAPATLPAEPAAGATASVPAKPAEPVDAPVAGDAAAVALPPPSAAPAVSAAETVAVPEPAQAAAPNPNERQMLLTFSGVSWVEVRDASNRIIYSGNSTPDSRQTVRGRPPFQLVIGNAQAVKLRYEDRAIDLQPHTRVDVARLTLDDNTK